MSFCDCPKCWEVLCTCGHQYQDWSIDKLIEFRKMIDGLIVSKNLKQEVISKKEPAYPDISIIEEKNKNLTIRAEAGDISILNDISVLPHCAIMPILNILASKGKIKIVYHPESWELIEVVVLKELDHFKFKVSVKKEG